jgi:hypothetical protein
MSDLTKFDFLESVRNRTTDQFKDKPVWDKYLQLMSYELEEIQANVEKLLQARDIDVAVGVQLDVLGRIVGIPRTLKSFELYEYFGFDGAVAAETFGSLSNEDGGFFRSLNSAVGGDYVLTDNSYRFFIKAQIIKNAAKSTPEEVVKFMSFLFGDNTKIYYKGGDAKMTIFFGKELNSFEKNLLNFYSTTNGYSSRFIMKTIGVGIAFATFQPQNVFAFQGFPNAKGFASTVESFGDSWGDEWGGGTALELGGVFATSLTY